MAGEEVVDAVQHELADGLEAGGVGAGEQGGVGVQGVLGQSASHKGWAEGVGPGVVAGEVGIRVRKIVRTGE